VGQLTELKLKLYFLTHLLRIYSKLFVFHKSVISVSSDAHNKKDYLLDGKRSHKSGLNICSLVRGQIQRYSYSWSVPIRYAKVCLFLSNPP
jgi:hypothetical protein